ncbi:MFS transporter [Nocardia sp. NPDC127526]|uniref:MFS transporter n=1 Tax=Nocardia sp. NPDC127526 TaxID=3345393 RepID=UPI003627171E
MTSLDTSARGGAPSRAKPPIGKLLAFTTAGFLAIVTETMPAGLLPKIAAGLHISESRAGQLVTLYALGSVAAAIPVITATRGLRRRPLLLAAVAGLLVFNTVTALSSSYSLTLAARFAAGMSAGVIWGLLAGYARRLVPEHIQGRALAVVGVGQPIALTLGVPLGTWLGSLLDWRAAFWIMSALAAALLVWIRALVPDLPGQAADARRPLRQVFAIPGVRPVLAVVLGWILAHNVLYTYVAPFLTHSGLEQRTDVVLLIFGAAAIAGIWITGTLVDRRLRTTTLVSLAVFAAATTVLATAGGSPAFVVAGTVAWGLAFGGAPTLLQTAIADAAGNEADVAQSMLVTVFNLAVAGGGLLGGFLLNAIGSRSLPAAAAVTALIALAAAAAAAAHGFRPGSRGGTAE